MIVAINECCENFSISIGSKSVTAKFFFNIPQGIDGHNPNRGTYILEGGSPSGAPLTGNEPGDFIVALDTRDPSNVTGTVWIWDTTLATPTWVDTHRDSNDAYFHSTELLSTVDIVNDLTTGGAHDVLSAEQGKELGLRTMLADMNQIEVTIDTSTMVQEGKFVSGNAWSSSIPSQPPGLIGDIAAHNVTTISLDGTEQYLRFNGFARGNSSNIGYAFYDAEGNTLYAMRFGTGGAKEFVVAVPEGSATFKTTSAYTNPDQFQQSDFYCYKIYGKTLPKSFGDVEDKIIQEGDLAKLLFSLGDLSEDKIVPLEYNLNGKGYWNANTSSVVTNATLYSHSYIDVEGYDRVAFLGNVMPSVTVHGYGFVDFEYQNPLSTTYDYDTNLTSEGLKTYVVDVPEGKKYLITETMLSKEFYCYGIKGTTIKESVTNEVLSDIDGMFLPSNTLDEYYIEQHGKNFIDWNNLLYGKYVSANKQTSHTNGVLTNPLYLENGKTYTFQNLVLFGTNLVAVYGCYDQEGKFMNKTVAITNTEVTGNDGSTSNGHQYGKGTLTYKNQGEAFIRFDVQTQHQLGQTENIQLEEGEEPTSIEPYSSEQVLDLATKQEVEDVNNQVKLVKEQIASIGTQNKLLNISLRFSNDQDRNIYTIMVMSKLSDNKNVAFKLRSKQYTYNPSKVTNLTLNSLYLGSNEVTNAEGLCVDSNLFNEMGDSISPLNWVKTDSNGNIDNSSLVGVPIFHQHGFSIARFMPSSTNPMTSEDVNSIWIGYDSSNNKLAEFAVGRVTTSSIYLVPQLTNDTEGSESLCFTFNDANKINKIAHKSGGVYTNDITGTSERFDLPIQIVEGLSFYADGNEVFVDANNKSVDIQCDEFKITQNILGKTPFGYENASDWFEEGIFIPDGCHDFVRFTENYIFNGTCCTYNVSMNTLYPFLLSTYKFVQPMYMEDTVADYNCKVFFPKAKRLVNNIPIDKGFASTTSEFHVSRYTDHLYDVNDMPDRSYAVLTNNEAETPYLVGLANGMSLNRGISIPSLKNSQIQIGSNYDVDNYCIRWARSAGNKVYYNLFTARGVGEGYNNRSINTNFVTTATGFFSIFDPNVNPGQQVFWYKESDYWILYTHAPELTGKQAINLPSIFEGMQVVETIEKTNGVTLLTDVVASGRIYVKYEPNANGQANFIVFKLL